MDRNSDMKVLRQATIQTWIDQAHAERARKRREWFVAAMVGAFCLFTVIAPTVLR